jgi:hypothetical protein
MSAHGQLNPWGGLLALAMIGGVGDEHLPQIRGCFMLCSDASELQLGRVGLHPPRRALEV